MKNEKKSYGPIWQQNKYTVMSQKSHCTQPTMYKYFYFKTEIKSKVDSYMPCNAMAHSPKYFSNPKILSISNNHFRQDNYEVIKYVLQLTAYNKGKNNLLKH